MKPSGQPNSLVVSVIVVLASIATGPTGSVVHAQKQQLADSIVGESVGYPVTLSSRHALWMLPLAMAARVPLGFEAAPLPPQAGKEWKIAATGRKLGDVLDEFVQMDPRYRWREDDGVIVVAPESPTGATYLLESVVGPVRFQNADARHVFRGLARLFDQTQEWVGPTDTTKFSLDFPGGTLRELLNSIVRAHGSLRWTLGYSRFVTQPERISLGLGTSSLAGVSIPPGTVVQANALENMPVDPSPEQSDVPILDRIVGRMTGQTVTVAAGGLPLDFLSSSLKVPMGLQRLPALPLMIDPASLSPDAPPPGTLLGRPFDWNGYPETRPISMDVSNGTLFDVLNAVVRAHGNMTWEWTEFWDAEREEHVAKIKTSLPKLRKVPPAPRYQLMFSIPGRGGMGFDVSDGRKVYESGAGAPGVP